MNLSNKMKKAKNSNMFILFLALIVIWGVFIIVTGGNFINFRNISNLLRYFHNVCVVQHVMK